MNSPAVLASADGRRRQAATSPWLPVYIEAHTEGYAMATEMLAEILKLWNDGDYTFKAKAAREDGGHLVLVIDHAFPSSLDRFSEHHFIESPQAILRMLKREAQHKQIRP